MHKRLISLDAFRGLAIILMMLVNHFADSTSFTFLQHAQRNGWTLADTVFPFFLWITGVTMVFSFDKKKPKLTTLLRRTIILFLLGLWINASPHYQLSSIRIPGILQRIAICYLLASMIFINFGIIGVLTILICFLIMYWILIAVLGPHFPQTVDVFFLKGHLWSPNFDPEGIISTIAATTTTLFGILAGSLIKRCKPSLTPAVLAGCGIILIILGQIMNIWLPINKSIWTSSYSVFMAGMAFFLFAIFYYLIEIKSWSNFFSILIVFGLNSLFIYFLSDIVTDYMRPPIYIYLILFYLFAYILYKRQWFIKV